MDIFKLYRAFWDFAFANPEKIKPTHVAVFSFAIEHCNRLGWKDKFGFPSAMAMEATGIKSYNTYIDTFMDLVDFGFFKLIEKSKNQYSSNIIALSIALSKNDKALDKALMKHTTKHIPKQRESTVQSTDSIIKQEDNQYTINQSTEESANESPNEIFKSKLLSEDFRHEREAIEISCKVRITEEMLRDFNANLTTQGKEHSHWSEYKRHLLAWIPKKMAIDGNNSNFNKNNKHNGNGNNFKASNTGSGSQIDQIWRKFETENDGAIPTEPHIRVSG